MKNDYLIISKSILPDYYEDVIEARHLINDLKYSVSEACKKMEISRNTYYKYKDCIFIPDDNLGKKAIFAFRLSDNTGILSNVLNFIANIKGNILAINQDMPIHGFAYVTITIDCVNFIDSIEMFIEEIKKINGVKTVELIALE